MAENSGIPFIAKVRKAGKGGSSLLVTIPKDVVQYLNLESDNLVQCRIIKLKGKP